MAKKKDELGGDEKGKVTSPEVEPETTPEAMPEQETGLKPKETPEEETFTYSKAERDEYVNSQKAALGRQLKDSLDVNATLKRTMDGNKTRFTDLETTISTMRARDRERELKAAGGDTEVISALKLKHQNEDASLKLSRDRSDFNMERAQHQAAIDKAAKFEATEEAKNLAADCGLTADLLLQIGSDTGQDGHTTYNLVRMKDIASKSPKAGSEGEEEEEEEEGGEPKSPVKGQRAKARSTGRSATRGLTTLTDYYEAYNRGDISNEEMAKARIRFGVAN